MTYCQQSLIGSGDYFPEDVKDVMCIMKEHPELENIITHEYKLDNLQQALETASDPDFSSNVVIKMKNDDTII